MVLIEERTEKAVCAGCSAEFERGVFVMGTERRTLGRTLCTRCGEAAAEAKREEVRRREEEATARAEAARRDSLPYLLRKAGANPHEHGHCTLENFDTSESGPAPLNAAREFLAAVREAGEWTPVRGLYLFGRTGPGKSHLAVGVLRALLLSLDFDPSTLVFDHAARLVVEVQDAYSTRRSVEEIMDRRVGARLWILDDLGTEQVSDDAVRKLSVILNERAMRPTLVTSNLAPHQLLERSPAMERIVSRLGPGYFRTVQVKGSDRRHQRLVAA